MVKGISRQVIVVHPSDRKFFEQAIFILNERNVGQEGVTDDELMKEAKRLLGESNRRRKTKHYLYRSAWAFGGAFLTGLVWLLTLWI